MRFFCALDRMFAHSAKNCGRCCLFVIRCFSQEVWLGIKQGHASCKELFLQELHLMAIKIEE